MSGRISPGGCNDCNGEDIVLSRCDLEDDNVQQMDQVSSFNHCTKLMTLIIYSLFSCHI